MDLLLELGTNQFYLILDDSNLDNSNIQVKTIAVFCCFKRLRGWTDNLKLSILRALCQAYLIPMSSVYKQHIRDWLQTFIVELNLCPFARPVVASDTLRITVCESEDLNQLTQAFLIELDLIQQSSASEIATTLLVMPNALASFDEYLMFLDNAEALIEELGLDGTIQLASFHPEYLFDGEAEESASHYSNRSPYPVIHFLREDMLTDALGEFPNPEQIPQRNISTLEKIGRAEIELRWQKLKGDSVQ